MKRTITAALSVLAVALLGGAAWLFTQGDVTPTTDVTAPPVAVSTTGSTAATATASFELSEGSIATFTIDEVLRGEPTTVVGTSDIVAGQILLDRSELSESRIGTVLINARAFATDSSLRDRAIRGPILDSGSFEFIEFEPVAVNGLSGRPRSEQSCRSP